MIADRVSIGIGLPQLFPKGRVDAGYIRRFAIRAEALGYSDVWVQEVFMSPGAFLDALDLLAYVAPLTRRVGLGVAVMVLPRHNPVIVAKRLATIDQLSGGRLIAGVGVGPARDSFGRVGESDVRSAERFGEAYDLLQRLWLQPRVRHEGRLWRVDEACMEPKPFRRRRPLVWFGGSHRLALRRAASLGDGWMGAGASTPQAFMEHSRVVRKELATHDRPSSEFTVSKRVYIGVDDDSDRGVRRFDEYREQVYGERPPSRQVAVVGSVDRCRDALNGLIAAGAEHLALTPVFDDEEQLELLAEVVGLSGRQELQPGT